MPLDVPSAGAQGHSESFYKEKVTGREEEETCARGFGGRQRPTHAGGVNVCLV